MTCFRCKGDTEHKLKTHAATLDQCVIIIKNVPALICKQCGEVYFSDDVMELGRRFQAAKRDKNIVDFSDAA